MLLYGVHLTPKLIYPSTIWSGVIDSANVKSPLNIFQVLKFSFACFARVFPDFSDQLCSYNWSVKKLSHLNMPKATTNTGTNAAAIRVIRLKPNYPALCFVAPKKVQSQKWRDASLSFHYLPSLIYPSLQSFSNAPEGVSTPKSTHSIVGRGLVPCWHLWTILGNSAPRPVCHKQVPANDVRESCVSVARHG